MKTQADSVRFRMVNGATIIERTKITDREHVVICKWGAFEFVTWVAFDRDGTGRLDAEWGSYHYSLVVAAKNYAERIETRRTLANSTDPATTGR